MEPKTGTTTPDQSGAGSNGNKEVTHTLQNSRIENPITKCRTGLFYGISNLYGLLNAKVSFFLGGCKFQVTNNLLQIKIKIAYLTTNNFALSYMVSSIPI